MNCPPEECPNSGENWFCRSENSATASLGTNTSGPVTPLLLLSTPSIVKLLLRGRWPPTDGPAPTPTPPLVATPAPKSEGFNTPLPEAAPGMSAIWPASKVLESCAVVVSSAGATPETSTVVTAPLMSSVIGSELVLFSSTLNPLMTVVAKLVEDAETLYVPTGKLLMRYSPRSLAFVVYFTPVSTFTASTDAPGTTAPVLSRIVPTKSPLII